MKNKKNGLKIVLFDIENSPNTIYSWGVWEQNAIDIEEPWKLLSFAYKELDKKQVNCKYRYQFKDETDYTLTKHLWELLNDADIVIAHNGVAFDIKKSNAKFLEHGFPPPSPYKVIDTLKVARKHFKLNSNRLDDLGKLLKVGRKEKHPGWPMWKGCMQNLRWAWRLMVKYNKKDVILLEAVYNKLRPWIDNHPNIAFAEDRLENCPKCDSGHLQSRGTIQTKTSTYNRYQCQSCFGWCRSRQEIKKNKKPKYVNI